MASCPRVPFSNVFRPQALQQMCIHCVAYSRHLSVSSLTNRYMRCQPVKPVPLYAPPSSRKARYHFVSKLQSLWCSPRSNSRPTQLAGTAHDVSDLTLKQRQMMLAWGGQTHVMLRALCCGQELSPRVLWRLLNGVAMHLMSDAAASRLCATVKYG